MATEEEAWESVRVRAANEASPVPGAVQQAIRERLGKALSERALRPSELIEFAKLLIADMETPKSAEAIDAD